MRTAGLLQLRDWGLAQACAPAQDGLWAPLSSPSPPPPAERGQVHGPTWPAGVSEDQAASETGADSMRPGQAAATAPLGCLHTQGSTGLLSPEPESRGVERCRDPSRAAGHGNGGADGARCSVALPSPLTGCAAHKRGAADGDIPSEMRGSLHSWTCGPGRTASRTELTQVATRGQEGVGAARREGGMDPCCLQCGWGVEANLWAQEWGASGKSVHSGDRPRCHPEKGQHPSASLSSLPPLQRSGLGVRFPSAPSVRRPLSVAQTSLSVSPLGATAGPGACWSGSQISIRSCPALQEPAVWWGHQRAGPWAPSWM